MEKINCLYKITKNDVLGRCMVAAKNIKQGQLIFKENPVILCPQIGGCTICFNCCAQVKKVYFCSKCAVAILCTPECKDQFHDAQECSTLKTTSIRREDLITHPEIITPLRCLLWRTFNKELFERLLELEDHLQLRRDSQIWRRVHINVETVLHKLKLIDDTDIKNEITQKICGILDINTFDARQPQRNRSGFNPGENLRGLFFNAALIAHNCITNVHLAVDDDFVLYAHAAVDIPEGQPVCFNYSNVLHGNDERKSQLKDGKYCTCNCSRCSDPTELGTEISSLKCPRCHKGLLRPPSWECSSCQRVFNKSMINMTLMEGRRRIDEIGIPDVDTLENLLVKLCFTFHPHHYLVLEVEQCLVRLYTQNSTNIKNLRRKIEICNKFLEVFQRIEPGISRIEAIALYELHSGVVTLAQNIYDSKEVDKEEFMRMLLLAENTLKSSIKYLLYEPIKSPEGRLAQNALSELKMLRVTINNFQSEDKKVEEKKKKKKNKGNKKKK